MHTDKPGTLKVPKSDASHRRTQHEESYHLGGPREAGHNRRKVDDLPRLQLWCLLSFVACFVALIGINQEMIKLKPRSHMPIAPQQRVVD